MTLRLIGAGFGRTGTLSVKAALERLGIGPCYHMLEVFRNPHHARIWEDAVDGAAVDWESIFAGYGSTVDWPGARFWRELADAYPDAKILLTVRDPEAWWKSASQTVFQVDQRIVTTETGRAQITMATKLLRSTFPGGLSDRAHAIDVYLRHNEAVKRAFGDRVLTYDVSEGWGPLARLFGVAVPDEPFPRTNSTEEFRRNTGLDKVGSGS